MLLVWSLNRNTFCWQFTYEDNILIQVTLEEWENFLLTYGGGYIQSGGVTIPVPTFAAYLDQKDADQQKALRKVLRYMLGDEIEQER